MHHAQTDVLLIKQTTHEPLRRLLLPTAGGDHARRAEEYVASFLRTHGGQLTVCGVAPPDADPGQIEERSRRLDEELERISADGSLDVDSKLIRHASVSVGIVKEAKNYDAVVIGATGHSTYQQILFGSIPETIAKRSDRPVILVKRHLRVKAMLRRVIGDET